MGKALSYAVREKIIERRKKGQPYKKIAEELDCSISGAKKIWSTFQKEGKTALITKYSNCGGHTSYDSEVRQAVKKIRDNQQGASYVRSKLIKDYPDLQAPCIRTLTRWWLEEGTNRDRGRISNREKKMDDSCS